MVSLDFNKYLTWQNGLFLAFAILIAIVAIYYRTTMLQYFGFYEPDGFYYFTAMRAIVNNNFAFPPYLSTSGWPYHSQIAEAHGLYWITLLPYMFLRYAGITYYTIMRFMPVVFALLDMLAAYLLSRYLSKDKTLGLLTILFVALSMGNAARTSALIYRGDTFATFFALMGLVFFIEIFKQEKRNSKIIAAVLAAVLTSGTNLVWNGGAFGIAGFMFAFMSVMAFAFLFRKDKIISEGVYVFGAMLLWFLIVSIAELTNFISAQQLTGTMFIVIFAALLVVWGAIYLISTRVVEIMRTPLLRLGMLVGGTVFCLLAFALLDPNLVYAIFVGNGFVPTGYFATTIQELQPPNFGFLFTSFSTELFASLPSLVMAVSTYFSGLQVPLWTAAYGALGVIFLLLSFLPYMLMQVYDSGGFLSGNPRVRLDLNVPMIVIMAFFVMTAYFQMHIIRFNSLVSVPVAIMAAYTIYWFLAFANKQQAKALRMIGLAAMGIIIISALVALIYYDNIYSSGLVQADSINPQFLGAMQWLKANSPNSSVVLTLWPDGSVVEAVANRTTVTDSVGSQNGTEATPFAAWLFSNTSDPQFLAEKINSYPNYLVVRNSWLEETQGIFTEANITANASDFGFQPIYSYNENTLNSTVRQLVLKNQDTYPYVIVNMQYSNTTQQLQSITGYVELSQNTFLPFAQVAFYDQYTQNYTLLNQTKVYNSTNGAMLLIQYSSVPKPGFYINLTGAYILAPGLGNSNMAKFLYFCGSTECAWNTPEAQMKLVYANSDTKIFSITYNKTV